MSAIDSGLVAGRLVATWGSRSLSLYPLTFPESIRLCLCIGVWGYLACAYLSTRGGDRRCFTELYVCKLEDSQCRAPVVALDNQYSAHPWFTRSFNPSRSHPLPTHTHTPLHAQPPPQSCTLWLLSYLLLFHVSFDFLHTLFPLSTLILSL
jgi:hypothetical protein